MKETMDSARRWFMGAVVVFLIAAAAVVVWHFRADESPFSWPLVIYLIWTLAISAVCAGAYWVDKRRARRDRPRIPERRLHLLEFVGGWPGAVLARRAFRHKTKKPAYRLRFWLIVLLHLGVIGFAVYRTIDAA